MSVVYIAGPITGHENGNREAFFRAEQLLKQQGYIVLNPHCLPAGLTEFQYMDICLAMLRSADAIYLLDDWQDSSGALVECALAKKLGLAIIDGDTLPSPAPPVRYFRKGGCIAGARASRNLHIC